MVILQINSVFNYGSTGKIVDGIARLVNDNSGICYSFYGRKGLRSITRSYKISSKFNIIINVIYARIFDCDGFFPYLKLNKMFKLIDEIKPDIIHLHNLHGYYINIIPLINYFKKLNIPIVMTLHDCWSFTGHCAHFDYIRCEKWKTHCEKCPQKREYPASIFLDRSYSNFELKRKLFLSIDNLILVSVSDWLNNQVAQSFLKDKKRIVIKNGIDLSLFKPMKSRNDIIKKYKIGGDHILLCVASIWEKRKGLDDILYMAEHLGKEYSIIVVGARISKKAKKYKNIYILKKLDNQAELAELYSAADLFINPTYQEALGLTNIEALACGTPVLTYNTGGSPETIDSQTGFVVAKGDVNAMIDIIKKFTINDKESMTDACRKRAERYFNKNERFMNYIKLYEKILKREL